MEELLRHRLSAASAAFAEARGISRAQLGRLILNDNTFFKRVLDDEQGFTVRIYDRVVGWMADNWPDHAVWPADVPRPLKSIVAANTDPSPEMARAG